MQTRPDRCQLRAQACADVLQHTNNHDRDEGGDQAVLNGCRGGFVASEADKKTTQDDLHLRTPWDVRRAATHGLLPGPIKLTPRRLTRHKRISSAPGHPPAEAARTHSQPSYALASFGGQPPRPYAVATDRSVGWRMGGDSNPRDPCGSAGFQDPNSGIENIREFRFLL